MRRELFHSKNFHWLDISHPSAEELQDLQLEYDLHPSMVQDCLDPVHLPKFEKMGSLTFMIVRIYDKDAPVGADTIKSLTRKIAIFVGPTFVITVHRLEPSHFQKFLDKALSELTEQDGQTLPVVLVKFLISALRTFHIPIEIAEDELDSFEAALFNKEAEIGMFKEVHIIRRRLSLMKRIMIHTTDVIQRLSPPGDSQGPLYQDLRENTSNLVFLLDELIEDTTSLLSLQISLASQKTNEVMRVLTVFSVFFMPLTFIVGIYGMNFQFMPEIHWEHGYLFAWLIMASVSLGIGLWFKRKGWLRFD